MGDPVANSQARTVAISTPTTTANGRVTNRVFLTFVTVFPP